MCLWLGAQLILWLPVQAWTPYLTGHHGMVMAALAIPMWLVLVLTALVGPAYLFTRCLISYRKRAR